jgi:hypothetical protein
MLGFYIYSIVRANILKITKRKRVYDTFDFYTAFRVLKIL